MIEKEEDRLCPICQRAKKSGAAGSITQWISTCRCGVSETQAAEDKQFQFCADCKKRVNTGKAGSITQWIFSDNLCKCKKLQMPDDPDGTGSNLLGTAAGKGIQTNRPPRPGLIKLDTSDEPDRFVSSTTMIDKDPGARFDGGMRMVMFSIVALSSIGIAFFVWRQCATVDDDQIVGDERRIAVISQAAAKSYKKARASELEHAEHQLNMVSELQEAADDTGFSLDRSGKASDYLKALAKQNKKMTNVVLEGSRLSAEDMKRIGVLQPQNVDLASCSGFNDATMKELGKCSSIVSLRLDGCKDITPAGVEYISKLPMLRSLSLDACGLTDAHLVALQNIPNLVFLRVRENKKVSLKGILNLRNRFPITVTVDQPTIYLLSAEKQQSLLLTKHIKLLHALPDEHEDESLYDLSKESQRKAKAKAERPLFDPTVHRLLGGPD
jgi:hypothetical protein